MAQATVTSPCNFYFAKMLTRLVWRFVQADLCNKGLLSNIAEWGPMVELLQRHVTRKPLFLARLWLLARSIRGKDGNLPLLVLHNPVLEIRKPERLTSYWVCTPIRIVPPMWKWSLFIQGGLLAWSFFLTSTEHILRTGQTFILFSNSAMQ